TVERGDLVQCVADRRRGSDHQRADRGVALEVGGKYVNRILKDAHGGAERPGDEMELVLDDQVGRSQAGDLRDLDGGVGPAAFGLLVVRLAGTAPSGVGVTVAVPRAPLGDVAEEAGRLSLARHSGELVDGREEEGWR